MRQMIFFFLHRQLFHFVLFVKNKLFSVKGKKQVTCCSGLEWMNQWINGFFSSLPGLGHSSTTLTGRDIIATGCIISSRGGKAERVIHFCLKYLNFLWFHHMKNYPKIQATVLKTWVITCLSFGMDKDIFPHVGDARTEPEEQCALDSVIFNANVPLLLSNRRAARVQTFSASEKTKSHSSSC